MRCSRSLLLFLMLSWVLPGAHAADDAVTPGLYVDADPAAIASHPAPGQRGKYRQFLNQQLQRNPRNVTALVQRAYLLNRAGDHERARRDFDAALAAAVPNGPEHRRVLWSRGWSRYDIGDVAGALDDWQESVRQHGGRPFWAAYTFALAHWTAGDKAQALTWYDAAVASNAAWGTEAGMHDKTLYWQPEQRERINALFTAWSAARTRME